MSPALATLLPHAATVLALKPPYHDDPKSAWAFWLIVVATLAPLIAYVHFHICRLRAERDKYKTIAGFGTGQEGFMCADAFNKDLGAIKASVYDTPRSLFKEHACADQCGMFRVAVVPLTFISPMACVALRLEENAKDEPLPLVDPTKRYTSPEPVERLNNADLRALLEEATKAASQ